MRTCTTAMPIPMLRVTVIPATTMSARRLSTTLSANCGSARAGIKAEATAIKAEAKATANASSSRVEDGEDGDEAARGAATRSAAASRCALSRTRVAFVPRRTAGTACLAFCLPTGWDCEGRGVARTVVGVRLGSVAGEGGGDDGAGGSGATGCGCACGCGGGGGGGGLRSALVVGGGSGFGTVVGGGSGLGIVVVVWAAAREPLTKT